MTKEKIVRQAEEISEAMQGMQVAMDKASAAKEERQLKITEFKKKYPDALYLEPTARIPTAGIPHPFWEKQREHLWEYVVGVFESQLVGSTLELFLTGLPSDDYCRWRIPVNRTIAIPRFLAKHLSEKLSWKEMKPLGRGNNMEPLYEDEVMKPFTQFETKRRGTFHPINAY
jgi:hypothetical protein